MDITKGLGVEIYLKNETDFLKIMETLTRMGTSDREGHRLFQVCHILHKKGRYAIMHYKEMFALDGFDAVFNEEDLVHRNKIVTMLCEWKLATLAPGQDNIIDSSSPWYNLKVVPFKDKNRWELIPNYVMGAKKRYDSHR